MKVIYEDNHIIVVEKPFNLPTQGDASGDICLMDEVKAYIKEKYQKPGDVFLGLVHRLDRVAGGLMVFARTSKGASRLSEEIRSRRFDKTYLAVIEGKPKAEKGQLRDFLLKDKTNNRVSVVPQGTPEAKEALLEYELLSTVNNLSCMKIRLITGRSHQIRIQFASRGLPLYGDVKYGSSFRENKGISLWSGALAFKHPTREEQMKFTLLPPNCYPFSLFEEAVKAIEGHNF